MSRLRAFAVFCYDFIIGDDWRLTLSVVLGLTATAALAHQGVSACGCCLHLSWSRRACRCAAPAGRNKWR